MKTIRSISALLLATAIFSGCVGDHKDQHGKDTVQNSYYVTPDSAKLDTGIAKSPDNSANGGVYLVKRTAQAKRDSAKMQIK